jgi:hypothetical protein
MREDHHPLGSGPIVGRLEQAAEMRATPSIVKWLPVTTCPSTRRDRSPRLSGANIGL